MKPRERFETLQTAVRVDHSRIFLVLSIALLAVLVEFDYVFIRPSDYYQLQIDWFIALNQSLSQWPILWSNITELGNAYIFFPVVSYLIVRHPQSWAALFGAVPLSCLFSSVGKHLAAVPRPAAILPHDQINIIGDTLTALTSFPSGHSITSFAVVTVVISSHLIVANGKRKWIWVTAGFLVAALLAVSRVAVGAHWPLDTVAGGFLGIIGGISGIALARRFHGWWAWMETRNGGWILSTTMLLWGFAIVFEMLSAARVNLPILGVSALCAIGVGIHVTIILLNVTRLSDNSHTLES